MVFYCAICFTIFKEHVIDMDWLEEEINRENRLERGGEAEKQRRREREKRTTKDREREMRGERERREWQRRQEEIRRKRGRRHQRLRRVAGKAAKKGNKKRRK